MKFNFKKVITAVMAVLLIASLLTGCVNSKVSSAVLADDEDVCFESTVREYFDGLQAEATIQTDIDYKWSKGWKGEHAPDTDDLKADEDAVTFVVEVTSYDEETTENAFAFFMGYNEDANTVRAYGGYINSDGEIEGLGKTEIEYFIALLEESV